MLFNRPIKISSKNLVCFLHSITNIIAQLRIETPVCVCVFVCVCAYGILSLGGQFLEEAIIIGSQFHLMRALFLHFCGPLLLGILYSYYTLSD